MFFRLSPQSLNGVWLNRERLAPLQGYCIRKGDHIQLGVPLESKEHAEYEYEVIEEDRESLAPCLAPKNDHTTEKHKGLRTKRKFSSDGVESLPAEGPSDLRCPLAKGSSKPAEPEKLHGKGEAASQPLGCLCPTLASLEASERTAGPHACSTLPKVLELYPKKQKACSPSASQSSGGQVSVCARAGEIQWLRNFLFFQVLLPAPKSINFEPLVTPVLGDSKASSLRWHTLTHTHAGTHNAYKHTINL